MGDSGGKLPRCSQSLGAIEPTQTIALLPVKRSILKSQAGLTSQGLQEFYLLLLKAPLVVLRAEEDDPGQAVQNQQRDAHPDLQTGKHRSGDPASGLAVTRP